MAPPTRGPRPPSLALSPTPAPALPTAARHRPLPRPAGWRVGEAPGAGTRARDAEPPASEPRWPASRFRSQEAGSAAHALEPPPPNERSAGVRGAETWTHVPVAAGDLGRLLGFSWACIQRKRSPLEYMGPVILLQKSLGDPAKQ